MMKFSKIVFLLFFIIITWGTLFTYPAVCQQIESRLNNLEFELNRLVSRLNQIELQLHQTNSKLPAIQRLQSNRRNLSQAERDKMFDRLATLFVELKQQVKKLEKRVKNLESQAKIK